MLPFLMGTAFFGIGVAPVLSAFAAELFPTEIRAQASAWIRNGFGNAGSVLGPAIVGVVGASSGLLGSIGSAVSVLALLYLKSCLSCGWAFPRLAIWRSIPVGESVGLLDMRVPSTLSVQCFVRNAVTGHPPYPILTMNRRVLKQSGAAKKGGRRSASRWPTGPSLHPRPSYNSNVMVGVDLVFIPEFRKQLEVSAGKILQSAFRSSEITTQEPEHLAGLWAAKEAVAKAAVEVPKKWTDIVITHDPSGKPHAKIGEQEFAVSISHHGDYAIAVAYRIAQ